MGIYDRDYARDNQPRPGSYGRGSRSPMAIWSVTTWLIVICIAVFVIDNLFLTRINVFVPTGTISASLANVPPSMVVDTDRVGNLKIPVKLPNGSVQERTLLVREVADKGNGTMIGWREVQPAMRPLEAYFHFSTRLGFLGFEWWRFIGFQFLHFNWIHLLFNMIGLFFFGGIVESYLGRKRYLAFYLLCGVFGAILYLTLNLLGYIASDVIGVDMRIPGLLFGGTWVPLVGASAGIFGILMAGAYLVPREEVLMFFVVPIPLRNLAYVLLLIAFVTVLTGGKNAGGEAAHIGGAIAGWYFIRHTHHLHGFFDLLGRADPTSHHYRRGDGAAGDRGSRQLDESEVNRVLDKVHEKGLQSLSRAEKRVLQQASDRRGA